MKLNKLKLKEISKNNLTNKEMKMVVGGNTPVSDCGCACKYEGNGGSSVTDNCKANAANSQFSPGNTAKCIYTGGGYSYDNYKYV